MIDLNDRLDLAFFERYKGEFVEGRACFVKDSILLIRKRIRHEKNNTEGLQVSKKCVPLQMTN